MLPKRIQQQFKQLIVQADQPAPSSMVKNNDEEDNDTGDTISISLEALHSSIEQVKLLKAGKLQIKSTRAMLAEVRAELAAEDAAKAKQTKEVA